MKRSLVPCFVTLSWIAVGAAALTAQPTYMTRDSAGVRIVENERPMWTRPWTIREAPVTRIEVEAPMGVPSDETGFISAASRLSDGSIVVLDVSMGLVRWYTPSGELLPSGGRGPFFVPVHLFGLTGDSIVVVDMPNPPQTRITVIASDGTTARTFNVRGEGQPVSRFANGEYLLRSGSMFPQAAESPTRVERLPAEIGRIAEGAASMGQLGLVSGPEVEIGPSGRLENGFARRSRPFGRDAIVAGHASGWVLGDTDRAELELRGSDERLEILARWPAPVREVTAADIDADRARRVRAVTNPAVRARMESRWALQPAPHETMPALGTVLLDSAGNVWAERYVPPAESAAGLLDVIDPSGVWLGTVQMPPGLRPLAVGDDWLLGVIRSENGPETILVLSIDKGPPAA